MSEHLLGQFDSWEIISETIARKTCDKSFFKYHGSGVPMEICWYFNVEDLPAGKSQTICFVYDGVEYGGYILKDTQSPSRTRIFWNTPLAKEFEPFSQDGKQPVLEFQRTAKDRYDVRFIDLPAIGEKSSYTLPQNIAMRDAIERFMRGYATAKNEVFANNPFGAFVRKEFPELLYETGLIDQNDYLITGSVGQGNWAMVPWICIFDRSITTSATKGEYIVYLLSKDCSELYLTFNQGCTDIRNKHSKKETIAIMREKARKIAGQIDNRGFSEDENISLGEGLTELGLLYQKGTIFYKKYEVNNIPDDEELLEDLSKMMDIYREYVALINGDKADISKPIEEEGEAEMQISVKDTIDQIKTYIASKGFTYDGKLIENFYLSLKSKPFVILAGTSGTGKTRLVKLFAEAIGAEYRMVSVRPDWSDGSDLFGHFDLNGKFVSGPVCDAFETALRDPAKPVFLCLDEMNLARVEYYLSDFLSVIESRDMHEDGTITTDAIAQYDGIPENLYIVGTVNMDETTFPFSKKVLDRANTIEFSYVDLLPDFAGFLPDAKPVQIENNFLKTEYLVLVRDCASDQTFVNQVCSELQKINEILLKANAHVGYRVRDEIVFYMLNNKNADDLLTYEQAFDNEIMQKILPRIQGSSTAIKDMLVELFKFCMNDYSGFDTESGNAGKQMQVMADSGKYPESAKKIGYMMTRYEEDGFTSYWL